MEVVHDNPGNDDLGNLMDEMMEDIPPPPVDHNQADPEDPQENPDDIEFL